MGQDDQVGQGQDAGKVKPITTFERLLDRDKKNEVRIFWSELGIIGAIAFAMLVYLIIV